jgi:hypothetical protein
MSWKREVTQARTKVLSGGRASLPWRLRQTAVSGSSLLPPPVDDLPVAAGYVCFDVRGAHASDKVRIRTWASPDKWDKGPAHTWVIFLTGAAGLSTIVSAAYGKIVENTLATQPPRRHQEEKRCI